jgi:6-phosphogluconate dehydrogenase
MKAPEIGDVFEAWNLGPLESFLVDLAARVLHVRDRKSGRPLVDLVLDAAAQKGTGRWTVQAALTLSVPVPTLAAAVDARTLSSDRAGRLAAAARLTGPPSAALPGTAADSEDAWIDAIHDALHASVICTWAQGLQLVAAANAPYGWDIDTAELARIWTGGCIIRARLLDEVREAYLGAGKLPNLVLEPRFTGRVLECEPRWRTVVAAAAQHGIPAPALSASLGWFDTIRAAELPTNLTQAQRDAFGAHTFVRRDNADGGAVHADWTPGAES